MKKTQIDFVIKQLLENGKISRNDCLKNYITRLGAIINRLNKEGWEIEGGYKKGDYGKDYVYNVIKSPFKKVVYYKKGTNEVLATKYEKA